VSFARWFSNLIVVQREEVVVSSAGRAIGLDVHLEFCEVAVCENGQVRSVGRVETKSLESRSFAQLPTYELAGEIHLRPDGDADGHVAELEVDADRPGSAKAAAVETIERFLAVLASWNYAFQVRIGGVRSEVVEGLGSVSTQRSESGVLEVTASDTIFVEGHVEAVVH